MQIATIYIKDSAVAASSLLDWTKVYLDIHGIPYSEFEETDFVDTNPVYTTIAEAARKLESKWGRE